MLFEFFMRKKSFWFFLSVFFLNILRTQTGSVAKSLRMNCASIVSTRPSLCTNCTANRWEWFITSTHIQSKDIAKHRSMLTAQSAIRARTNSNWGICCCYLCKCILQQYSNSIKWQTVTFWCVFVQWCLCVWRRREHVSATRRADDETNTSMLSIIGKIELSMQPIIIMNVQLNDCIEQTCPTRLNCVYL